MSKFEVAFTEENLHARFREMGVPMPEDVKAKISVTLIPRIHDFFQGKCLMVRHFSILEFSTISIIGQTAAQFKPYYVQNDAV